MTDPVGLSIGTTNLVVARVGIQPVTRRSVVTLFRHRPPEVGLPSENPNLNEPGLVIRGFVERVGDPVPIVAADGSSHQADQLLIEGLAALVNAAGLSAPADDIVIAVPAYWNQATVRTFEAALRRDRTLAPNGVAPRLVSDATTALTALQTNPGLAGNGIVALLDFGASGTSITLADAERGFQPIGETRRYPDFSGDQVDQALLTTVLAGLSSRGEADPAATAAVGSLVRLREECRRAKERLSAETAATVTVELPGERTEVRVTRAELDALLTAPLNGVLGALEEQLDRNRLVWSNISAVATVGGGASIPLVTQRLSELSRVSVVTTPRPDLDSAIGAALTAARGPSADAPTGIGTAIGDAATAGIAGAGAGLAGPSDDAPGSATFRALAWSQDDDSGAEPVPYTGPNPYAISETGARPQIEYTPSTGEIDTPPRRLPTYAIAGAAAVALIAAGGVTYSLTSQSTSTTETSTPTPSVTVPINSTPIEPPPPPPEPPPTVTVTQEPPPPPVTTAEPPPPPVTTTTTEPTTTTTTTTEPTTTTTTTTTTTEPTTTTTTPTTTSTTTTAPTTTTPPITTTHLNIPGLPPIPIPVPQQPQP